jgi:hypothetical protein
MASLAASLHRQLMELPGARELLSGPCAWAMLYGGAVRNHLLGVRLGDYLARGEGRDVDILIHALGDYGSYLRGLGLGWMVQYHGCDYAEQTPPSPYAEEGWFTVTVGGITYDVVVHSKRTALNVEPDFTCSAGALYMPGGKGDAILEVVQRHQDDLRLLSVDDVQRDVRNRLLVPYAPMNAKRLYRATRLCRREGFAPNQAVLEAARATPLPATVQWKGKPLVITEFQFRCAV